MRPYTSSILAVPQDIMQGQSKADDFKNSLVGKHWYIRVELSTGEYYL